MADSVRLRAGRLRHRVTFVRQDESTPNALGETSENPVPGPTRYADIRPLSGRELFLAQQVQADVTHEIELRYTPGISPKMQCLYQGRTFNIEAVRNVEERNRKLILLCKESV